MKFLHGSLLRCLRSKKHLRSGIAVVTVLLYWQALPLNARTLSLPARWYGATFLAAPSGSVSRGFKATISVPASITWAGPSSTSGTVPLDRKSQFSNSVSTQVANLQFFQIGWRMNRGDSTATTYYEYYDDFDNSYQKKIGNSVALASVAQTYKIEYVGNHWCGYINGTLGWCGSKNVPKAINGIVQSEVHYNPHISLDVVYSQIRYINDANGADAIPVLTASPDYPYSVAITADSATVSGPDSNALRISIPIGPQP
jgi:hypothetical protein